jgi:bifunctional non-homologous end joining protein LigD
MSLETYHRKRSFQRTDEPEGRVGPTEGGSLYVIQKHAARRLHYDLRLELDGVLKSWAVPKGPSLKPGEKRLAVHVEDHPVEYGSFEGTIPEGEYGAGTVMLWDRGSWLPEGDPHEGYAKGDLKFRLFGERLKGAWVLARMKGKAGEEDKNWLLIKKRDDAAISGSGQEPVETFDGSVASGRTMQQISSEDDNARIDPSALPGARRTDQPEFIHPQTATLANRPPAGENWLHEIKYDGYRILCELRGGRARLFSRNQKDWTDRFPHIAKAVTGLPIESAILDGEVAVVDEHGRTDFQAVQNILQGVRSGRLIYFLFDLPFCSGYDLSDAPLIERKELLKKVLSLNPSEDLKNVDHIRGQGDRVFRSACRLGLEGIVSKLADSRYEKRRSKSWLKVKCSLRQEFVIGGFTAPGGSRTGFGALLLGYYNPQGDFIYAGKAGTGFTEQTLEILSNRLRELEAAKPPFINFPTGYEAKGVRWTRPELVAEVEFSAWTEDGMLRHPSFKGLREDKDPEDVVRERKADNGGPGAGDQELQAEAEFPRRSFVPRLPSSGRSSPHSFSTAISNPDRLLYPEIGVTKLALAEYYYDVADWMMPHLAGRPLTLVRCPEGLEGECFFQKHLGDSPSPALRSIEVIEKHAKTYYSVAHDIEGVIALVQMGALEIHVWGSREADLERPDMMIFDLDPAPEVEWSAMIDTARLMRERLSEQGLEAFVKTTGGKGLHVVVPLTPGADWETVKAFSKSFAESIVKEDPEKYIATMSKKKRSGKIFIDYLRNGRGATSIAAFSTRRRRSAPISTPLAWDELTADLRSDSYDIRNIRRRLSRLRDDPWAGYFSIRQEIPGKLSK